MQLLPMASRTLPAKRIEANASETNALETNAMTHPETLPAILLAAGASTRLGQPKQLLCVRSSFENKTDTEESEALLDRTLRVTLAAHYDPVFVVLGAHAEKIQRTAQLVCGTILHNSDWQEGMASSIRCGMEAVARQAPETSGLLLLVCDQPALTSEHLQALLAAHRAAPEKIIASRYAERPEIPITGVPILAPRSIFPELAALAGDRGAKEILRSGKYGIVEIPFPLGAWDIDSPEDIAAP